ncbi:hypothetical protein GCM10023403_25320 [Pseudonocardia benzenivorans]
MAPPPDDDQHPRHDGEDPRTDDEPRRRETHRRGIEREHRENMSRRRNRAVTGPDRAVRAFGQLASADIDFHVFQSMAQS